MDAVDNGARLVHFPVSFFAVVMGLSGLTLAVERMEATLGTPHVWSLGFVVVSVAAFIIIGAFYLTKLLRHRSARSSRNGTIRCASPSSRRSPSA